MAGVSHVVPLADTARRNHLVRLVRGAMAFALLLVPPWPWMSLGTGEGTDTTSVSEKRSERKRLIEEVQCPPGAPPLILAIDII